VKQPEIIGIAEGKENGDCIAFLNTFLPAVVGIHSLEGGFEIWPTEFIPTAQVLTKDLGLSSLDSSSSRTEKGSCWRLKERDRLCGRAAM